LSRSHRGCGPCALSLCRHRDLPSGREWQSATIRAEVAARVLRGSIRRFIAPGKARERGARTIASTGLHQRRIDLQVAKGFVIVRQCL
jgi:hypothetical protein